MATLITSDYTDKTPDEQVRSVLDQPWYLVEDMRTPAKAKQIAEIAMDLTTTRHRAQFGNVMEPLVADSFDRKVLKLEQPPRRRRPEHRGGRGHGSDLLWDELAALYGELARELGYPFFAELAAELATYGETQAA